ncbi:NUDIX hydrolase [Pseudotabrizicola sp. L79]|uniref:NUDIX hydrolase n=1 Tax=Pseudotabrizicola sp. L79 TaxID=3118402 RepID=UPI002F9469C2
MTNAPIRSAATVILWRRHRDVVELLMGQRGAGAAFMPSKYVFPGGAVDPGDDLAQVPMSETCLRRLGLCCPDDAPRPAALAGAALRELREETGLHLAATDAPALRFFFRAITPPGRTRRFDARFFLADAAGVAGDLNDFSEAEDELSHLHWIGLPEAKALDLPFITEVVLAEVTAHFAGAPDRGVPFFDNSGDTPLFRRLV